MISSLYFLYIRSSSYLSRITNKRMLRFCSIKLIHIKGIVGRSLFESTSVELKDGETCKIS